MKKFVVYAHYTLDTNELFYIGEGTIKRSKSKSSRSRWWNFKVLKHGFKVRILYSNLSKLEAENIETRMIRNLKKRESNIVNLCVGPMYKNHWLVGLPKEMHPMFGKKCPSSSKRITEWNKQHSGINSPVYGLKRPDLIARNKLGLAKRATKSVKCNETNQIFNSIKEACIFHGKENSNMLSRHLTDSKVKKAFGYTWSYNDLIKGNSLPE